MLMILPKTINERFYKALKEKKGKYGRGFNKFLCGETGYSTGYMSQILNGKQDASQESQIKISDACGLDYKSFLTETGRQELQPTPTTNQEIAKLQAEMIEVKAKLPATKLEATMSEPNDIEKQKTLKNQPHHDLVNKFRHPDLAYELNEKIYEMEGLSLEAVEELNDYMDLKLKRLRKKHDPKDPQKKTSNGN